MADTVLATMRRGAMPTLPYDAEVEYLESSGTQWIDTETYSDSTTRFEIKLRVAQISDQSIFGGRISFSDRSYVVWTSQANKFRFDYTATGADNKVGPATVANHDYVIVKDAERNFIDGTAVVSNSTKSFVTTQPAYLFAVNDNGTNRYRFRGRVYYAKISSANISIRDMIPVRFTNSLGQTEGAMFDRVSGRLFRNAGTGAFVVGPDKQTFTANLGVLSPLKEQEV